MSHQILENKSKERHGLASATIIPRPETSLTAQWRLFWLDFLCPTAASFNYWQWRLRINYRGYVCLVPPEVTTEIFFLCSQRKIFWCGLVFWPDNKDGSVLSFISLLECCHCTTTSFQSYSYTRSSPLLSSPTVGFNIYLFKAMERFTIILCGVPRKLDCVINQWWFDRCWKLFLLDPATVCPPYQHYRMKIFERWDK